MQRVSAKSSSPFCSISTTPKVERCLRKLPFVSFFFVLRCWKRFRSSNLEGRKEQIVTMYAAKTSTSTLGPSILTSDARRVTLGTVIIMMMMMMMMMSKMLANNVPFRTVPRSFRNPRTLILSTAVFAGILLLWFHWLHELQIREISAADDGIARVAGGRGGSRGSSGGPTASSQGSHHDGVTPGSIRTDDRNSFGGSDSQQETLDDVAIAQLETLNATSRYFADHPLGPPYRPIYGELGGRAKVLGGWLDVLGKLPAGPVREEMQETTDRMASSLFPYLRTDQLSQLRKSFAPGKKGIVIAAGGREGFRFACHLVGQLRKVYKTDIPIMLAYAGNEDLSPISRRKLDHYLGMEYEEVQYLDLWKVFDDDTIQLLQNGWATKAFALLAAPWEEVVMLDADAVLLQDPRAFFDHEGYREKGALLYHDRALFQYMFRERIDWWKGQIKHPGPELAKSKVWSQSFPEEGDSGAIVMNKGNTGVLMGLMHAAWQNSFDQREETTYKISYGDKETYWFGLELAGATYTFSDHYGAMAGWPASKVLGRRPEVKPTPDPAAAKNTTPKASYGKAAAMRQRDPQHAAGGGGMETGKTGASSAWVGNTGGSMAPGNAGAGTAGSSNQGTSNMGAGQRLPGQIPGGYVGGMDLTKRICSFTIAHTDDKGSLLWLNGGLLLNKLMDKKEFDVPTHWVLDGRWQKGIKKEDLSCMVGEHISDIPKKQQELLQSSIDVAKEMDAKIMLVR
ncbi:mannosyltransferase putative-domain-containing protein [Zalerion maritima]|uniref:Mannosyltransferase putative-domain-containing protein n=1 Tax=Zalerion maritima TaxID=339359 RepID=A0AAD5WNK7_9PEZI|nr:mannosyltransferase putative-domain-containing protein [Zalerion maritima]